MAGPRRAAGPAPTPRKPVPPVTSRFTVSSGPGPEQRGALGLGRRSRPAPRPARREQPSVPLALRQAQGERKEAQPSVPPALRQARGRAARVRTLRVAGSAPSAGSGRAEVGSPARVLPRRGCARSARTAVLDHAASPAGRPRPAWPPPCASPAQLRDRDGRPEADLQRRAARHARAGRERLVGAGEVHRQHVHPLVQREVAQRWGRRAAARRRGERVPSGKMSRL